MQMNHNPKVVAPSRHTGQPVLIKKSFAFSKSVVWKLHYRNQPHFYPLEISNESFYIKIIVNREITLIHMIRPNNCTALCEESNSRPFDCIETNSRPKDSPQAWLELAPKSSPEGQWLKVHEATP